MKLQKFIQGLLSALASSFRETIDEFDNEFNIIVLDDDLKAEEEQRLKEVEANINEHNKKFANGEATYGEKLYAFSDLSEDEIKKAKTGLTGGFYTTRFGGSWDPKRGDAPPERSTGLIMPPESERISSPQEELESLYAMDRGYTPRTYFAVNDGNSYLVFPPKNDNITENLILGLVTIAKNQGNCGSCAAFAASGLHETCMAKAGAPVAKLDLSEQYLIDCGFNKG